jgi:hypothetical protein
MLAWSEQACDQWHSSRVFTPLTSWHCKLRPNTEGPITSDYPNFPVMTDERWCLVRLSRCRTQFPAPCAVWMHNVVGIEPWPHVRSNSSYLGRLVSSLTIAALNRIATLKVNSYKTTPVPQQNALHMALKEAYCSQRRLTVDRMECGGAPTL